MRMHATAFAPARMRAGILPWMLIDEPGELASYQ